MDEDTAREIKNLESENKQLLSAVKGQSKHHLTANEELKKGVLEDLFDTVLGDD